MVSSISPTPSSQLHDQRKRDLLAYFEAANGVQDTPTRLNAAFRVDDRKFMKFLIPPGKRVLELGCGSGDLLAALEPSYGVGGDFGAETLARARGRFPPLNF